MYVCICNNVTESDIESAVHEGARTLDCLADRLLVSTCCGQCSEFAHECLQAALETVAPTTVGATLGGAAAVAASGSAFP